MRTTYLLVILDVLFAVYILQSTAIVFQWTGSVVVNPHSVSVTKLPIADLPRVPVLQLNSFETQKDIDNWMIQYGEPNDVIKLRTTDHHTHGLYALKLIMPASSWVDMTFTHFPQEWGEYKMLALDMFNAGSAVIEAKLRIGYSFGDLEFNPYMSKFVEKRRIPPGRTTWVVPLSAVSQKIHLNGPHKIIRILFVGDAGEIILDSVRLER